MSQSPSSKPVDIAAWPPSQVRCLNEDGLQRHCLNWPPHTSRLLRDANLVTEAKSESPFISSPAAVKNVLNRIAALCIETEHPNFYLGLEGKYRCRIETISVLQLYVEPLNEVYLLDISALGLAAFTISTNDSLCLKNLLQNGKIKKASFDPKQDSAALYALCGIKLEGVIDVQVMHCAVSDPTNCVLSFNKCTAELPIKDEELHCGREVQDKNDSLSKDNERPIFDKHPLPSMLLQNCIQNVVLLAALYRQCMAKMTPKLWRNCNDVFHIRHETSLAPDSDVIPKRSRCPCTLHKKGNFQNLLIRDVIDWGLTDVDTALGLGNADDRAPDWPNRQEREQDEQKIKENVKTSPDVFHTSLGSRRGRPKQGPLMRQDGTFERENITASDDEELGYDLENSLLRGRTLLTQENRVTSAFNTEMSFMEETAEGRTQRERAQTSFNSSDPLNSSFFDFFNTDTPQVPPALPAPHSSANRSSLASSSYPGQSELLDSSHNQPSFNQSLTSSYYPGQTRMLDSSFDQSIIRAPTPQPDFSYPSPERRVSVTRRPAAMDGIAQAFRDEQMYSDTASFNTGGILTDSSSSGDSDQRSTNAFHRQPNVGQAQSMTQVLPTLVTEGMPPVLE